MRFENTISDKRVIQATDRAEALLSPLSDMILYIEMKSDWRYDIKSGKEAAITLLLLDNTPTRIEIYYPSYKNSAQTAAWDGKRIGINGYWLHSASERQIIAAIIHEFTHKKGFHHQDRGVWGYVRRNYWTQEKSNFSLPYHLSDNIGLWL